MWQSQHNNLSFTYAYRYESKWCFVRATASKQFYTLYATYIVHKVYKNTAYTLILSTSFLRLFSVIGTLRYRKA